MRRVAKRLTYLDFFLAEGDFARDFHAQRLVGLWVALVLGLQDVFVLFAMCRDG